MKGRIAVFIFLCCFQLSTLGVSAQDINKVMVSIDLKGVTMKEAFNRIEKLSPFKFSYKSSDIAGIKDIWYKQSSVSVKKLLDDLFSKTSLQYELIQNYIMVKRTIPQAADKVTLYGF